MVDCGRDYDGGGRWRGRAARGAFRWYGNGVVAGEGEGKEIVGGVGDEFVAVFIERVNEVFDLAWELVYIVYYEVLLWRCGDGESIRLKRHVRGILFKLHQLVIMSTIVIP